MQNLLAQKAVPTRVAFALRLFLDERLKTKRLTLMMSDDHSLGPGSIRHWAFVRLSNDIFTARWLLMILRTSSPAILSLLRLK